MAPLSRAAQSNLHWRTVPLLASCCAIAVLSVEQVRVIQALLGFPFLVFFLGPTNSIRIAWHSTA